MSSTYDRAVTSLMSFMAGFFPPPTEDKTLPIQWQPFPFSQDHAKNVIAVSEESCTNYYRQLKVVRDAYLRNVTSWMVKEKPLLDRIGNVVGVPIDNFETLTWVTDLLQSNRFLDPTMPKWLLDAVDNKLMKKITTYYYELMNDDLSKTVTAGNMIREIINNMLAIRDGNGDAKNFLLYSGHDVSVINLGKLLGVESQLAKPIVKYADTLVVEQLKARGSSEFQVQVVYVSNGKKSVLNVPNCGKMCSRNVFVKLFSKFMLTDWNVSCGS